MLWSNPLTEIASIGAGLSDASRSLHAAYLEYADPKGSNMEFVEARMQEAGDALRELLKRIEGWRG